MINVILPVVNNPEKYEKMMESFERDDVLFYVGALEDFKSLKTPKNAVVKFFKHGSGKEEIINSLHSYKKERGAIMVVRRPLEKEEFSSLISAKEGDICYLKRPKSRFSRWWGNLWRKLIKRIFAFYYFEDISAILFKENMFELVISLTNLSYCTRIDRFVGFKEEEVAAVGKNPKREYDSFFAYSKLLAVLLFFALTIITSIILIESFQPIAIMVLLSILLCIVGLTATFGAILNFVRTLFVGTLRHGRAEECLKI